MKKCALSGVIAFLLVVTVLAAGCMTNVTNKNSTQTLSTSTSNVTAQTSSISFQVVPETIRPENKSHLPVG
ncbi:MAG: hypothetical protein WCE81_08500 [Halobacteriota archaeon]